MFTIWQYRTLSFSEASFDEGFEFLVFLSVSLVHTLHKQNSMLLLLLYISTLLTSALLVSASSQLLEPSAKSIVLPLKRFGTLKKRYISPGHRLVLLQQRTVQDAMKHSKTFKKSYRSTGAKRYVKVRTRSATVQMQAGTNDYYYFATVYVGTPPIEFKLQLDTGSSDMILMTNSSTANLFPRAQLFQPSKSLTAKVSTTQFSIGYISGDASGQLVDDIVKLGGYNRSQTFATVGTSNGIYHEESGVSGILGLAWRDLSSSGSTPFLQALSDSAAIELPLFTMAFAREKSNTTITPGGFISLGVIDPNLFTGNITYTKVSATTYWQIPLDSISIGSMRLDISTKNAQIDSGTSLIYLPRHAVIEFWSKVAGSSDIGGGIFTYPCAAPINASFSFGGATYPVLDIDLNLGNADHDGNCIGGVAWFDDSSYIIGDVFLKNVFSVFRFSPASIGFATLAGENYLQRGLATSTQPSSSPTTITSSISSTLTSVNSVSFSPTTMLSPPITPSAAIVSIPIPVSCSSTTPIAVTSVSITPTSTLSTSIYPSSNEFTLIASTLNAPAAIVSVAVTPMSFTLVTTAVSTLASGINYAASSFATSSLATTETAAQMTLISTGVNAPVTSSTFSTTDTLATTSTTPDSFVSSTASTVPKFSSLLTSSTTPTNSETPTSTTFTASPSKQISSIFASSNTTYASTSISGDSSATNLIATTSLNSMNTVPFTSPTKSSTTSMTSTSFSTFAAGTASTYYINSSIMTSASAFSAPSATLFTSTPFIIPASSSESSGAVSMSRATSSPTSFKVSSKASISDTSTPPTSSSSIIATVASKNSSAVATFPLYKILVVSTLTGAKLGYVSSTESSFGALTYSSSQNDALVIKGARIGAAVPMNLIATKALNTNSSRFHLGISLGRYGSVFDNKTKAYGWVTQTNPDSTSQFFSLPSDVFKAESNVWMITNSLTKAFNGHLITLSFIDSSKAPVKTAHFFRQASRGNAIGFSSSAIGVVPTFDSRILLYLVPAS